MGQLWGYTGCVTNNTQINLGGNHTVKQIAYPIYAETGSIEGLQVYMRNNGGVATGYTFGDGGTYRLKILGDNGGSPDESNVIWSGPEYVGDASMWSGESEFLAAYPGSTWYSGNTSVLSAAIQSTGGVSVTVGNLYWFSVEQVRGGSTNNSSVNFLRGGTSDDYGQNMLERTKFPTQQWLAKQKNSSGVWSELERHPIFTVRYSGGVVVGHPTYNVGVPADNVDGLSSSLDRWANLSSSEWVRMNWSAPSGSPRNITEVWVGGVVVASGSGTVEVRIDGSLAGSIPLSNFPSTNDFTNWRTIMEPGRWRSIPVNESITGTSVIELRVNGSGELKIGQGVQGAYFIPLQAGTNGSPDADYEWSSNSGSTWNTSGNSGNRKYSIALWDVSDDPSSGVEWRTGSSLAETGDIYFSESSTNPNSATGEPDPASLTLPITLYSWTISSLAFPSGGYWDFTQISGPSLMSAVHSTSPTNRLDISAAEDGTYEIQVALYQSNGTLVAVNRATIEIGDIDGFNWIDLDDVSATTTSSGQLNLSPLLSGASGQIVDAGSNPYVTSITGSVVEMDISTMISDQVNISQIDSGQMTVNTILTLSVDGSSDQKTITVNHIFDVDQLPPTQVQPASFAGQWSVSDDGRAKIATLIDGQICFRINL